MARTCRGPRITENDCGADLGGARSGPDAGAVNGRCGWYLGFCTDVVEAASPLRCLVLLGFSLGAESGLQDRAVKP